MYVFRTKDSPEKECISLLFLVFIVSVSIGIFVGEKVTGKKWRVL